MPKIHINEVYTKDTSYPLIINFQNGYPTENFQAEKCTLLENVNNKTKCVTVELNNMLYAGDEENELLGRTLILARNRTSGKTRLIEVGCAQLKPILRVDNDAASLQDTSYLELSRKFGSKKQKQKVEHKEKLKVNVQTVTEQMQSATENITEDKLDLSSYNKSDSDDFYIPLINRLADKPEDVYSPDKILTEDEYDRIYSEMEGKDFWDTFVPFIKSIADQNMSQWKIVLAVYADCLIKFTKLKAKDLARKNYAACPYSSTLNDIIMKKFTTLSNGKRCRPMPYKDKAICHVMVFALIVNRLKFDMESFAGETNMTIATTTNKAKVTGASVVNVSGKKVLQLKLPLATKGGFRRKSAKF